MVRNTDKTPIFQFVFWSVSDRILLGIQEQRIAMKHGTEC